MLRKFGLRHPTLGLSPRMMLLRVTLDVSTPGYLLVARYICIISVVDPKNNFECMAGFKRRPDQPARFLPLTIGPLNLANPVARQTY